MLMIHSRSLVELLLQITITSWCVVVVVNAWGTLGHQIVGNLAWTLLSPVTRDSINRLLNGSSTTTNNNDCQEYCSPLAVVADWADRVRYYKPWSAPLHFIDVQDDAISGGCPVVVANNNNNNNNNHHDTHSQQQQCEFVYERDCENDVCVAGAILNYTKALNDHRKNNGQIKLQTNSDLQEDLKFLVHFVGDIHQPLHCSRKTDKGGNSIHLRGVWKRSTNISNGQQQQQQQQQRDYSVLSPRSLRSSIQRKGYTVPASSVAAAAHSGLNLHHVWDDTFIETAISEGSFNTSRNAWELDLINDIWWHRQDWDANDCANGSRYDCVNAWATDSFDLAMQFAYADEHGQAIVDGSTLSRQYYESRLPIVRLQLAKAGYRLARTLEIVFAGK